jgi:hypothetical protein
MLKWLLDVGTCAGWQNQAIRNIVSQILAINGICYQWLRIVADWGISDSHFFVAAGGHFKGTRFKAQAMTTKQILQWHTFIFVQDSGSGVG